MRLTVVLLLLCLGGCSALEDKATEYVSDLAVRKITEAVDNKLEERGLSLTQLKTLADADADGTASKTEVVDLTKSLVADYVALHAAQHEDKIKAELEAKFREVASAEDLAELKAKAAEQDLFGKGTLTGLVGLLISYLLKQVFSAKSDAQRDARIAVLEGLTKRDLNGDGVVGAKPEATQPPVATT